MYAPFSYALSVETFTYPKYLKIICVAAMEPYVFCASAQADALFVKKEKIKKMNFAISGSLMLQKTFRNLKRHLRSHPKFFIPLHPWNDI